ncbi:hypothetical protein [Streptomyces sp. bgisy027]|uniref:hypothetical protein n=1 Tax=Streptomyces sp. bgisy027 TaxID=3413770 RepID=UPI003D71C6CD
MADRYDAGAVAWATGDIPVLITTIILAIQWVRSDRREARRVGRRSAVWGGGHSRWRRRWP